MLKVIYIISIVSAILMFLGLIQEVKDIIRRKYPFFVPPKSSISRTLSTFASMMFIILCPAVNTIIVVLLIENHGEIIKNIVKKFEEENDLR